MNNSSNQGIKKIHNGNEGERIIDKKSLSIGKKKEKNDDICCV